jgi:hypothetical protein
VVLLAPLDSLPALGAAARVLITNGRQHVGRLAACCAILLLALLGITDLPLEVRRVLWYLQALPVLYLLLTATLEILAARRPYSPGAVSHAGALAVLLTVAESTSTLGTVELWAVALGSSGSGRGLHNLLQRYPFDSETTLFVSLEGLGVGDLCYVREGDGPRGRGADVLLLEQARLAAAEARVEALPQVYRDGQTLAGRLRDAGMRTLTITCLDGRGHIPLRHMADDSADQIDEAVLERASLLVASLVRRLEGVA